MGSCSVPWIYSASPFSPLRFLLLLASPLPLFLTHPPSLQPASLLPSFLLPLPAMWVLSHPPFLHPTSIEYPFSNKADLGKDILPTPLQHSRLGKGIVRDGPWCSVSGVYSWAKAGSIEKYPVQLILKKKTNHKIS